MFRCGAEFDLSHTELRLMGLELFGQKLRVSQNVNDGLPDETLDPLCAYGRHPAPLGSAEPVAPEAAVDPPAMGGCPEEFLSTPPAPKETSKEIEPDGRTPRLSCTVARELSLRLLE